MIFYVEGESKSSMEAQLRREQPSTYGRHLWNYLAQFGRTWTKKAHWMAAIDYISDCLNPYEPGNHGTGCQNCAGHWAEILRRFPPDKVNNRVEAAVWVHFVHNVVNQVATPPKPQMHYNDAAKLTGFGWETLTEENYRQVKTRLGLGS